VQAANQLNRLAANSGAEEARGERFWFLMTALLGVNCIAKVRQPSKPPRS
jgi:hypothetical protein